MSGDVLIAPIGQLDDDELTALQQEDVLVLQADDPAKFVWIRTVQRGIDQPDYSPIGDGLGWFGFWLAVGGIVIALVLA